VEGYTAGNVQLKLNQVVTAADNSAARAAPSQSGQVTPRQANAPAAGKAGRKVQQAPPVAAATAAPQPVPTP
jgi:hypothetical protein